MPFTTHRYRNPDLDLDPDKKTCPKPMSIPLPMQYNSNRLSGKTCDTAVMGYSVTEGIEFGN